MTPVSSDEGPPILVVIAMGRWSAVMRRIETALSLITCALLTWTVLDGPVFMSARSDTTAKILAALIVLE